MKRVIDRRVLSAQAEVTAKRAEIVATIGELRHRLDPRVIAAETASDVKGQVSLAIRSASTAAKAQPWLLVGASALIAAGVAAVIKFRSDGGEEPLNEATNDDA